MKYTRVEWPTLAVALACYSGWLCVIVSANVVPLVISFPCLAVLIAWHSSLQHEAIHGHPFRNPVCNEILVFLPLGLFFPYRRFRSLHLKHHDDPNLTDPFDDPESFYLESDRWDEIPAYLQRLLRLHNSLAGRLVFGPLIAILMFLKKETQLLAAGNREVAGAWGIHLAGLVFLYMLLSKIGIPLWIYIASAYAGLSLLMLRTFLEHQAHQMIRCRTAIIEDKGFLALLFLNNNLHAVHHLYPEKPWYDLPEIYQRDRDTLIQQNGNYRYSSYGEVIRRYAFRSKEEVAYPTRLRVDG